MGALVVKQLRYLLGHWLHWSQWRRWLLILAMGTWIAAALATQRSRADDLPSVMFTLPNLQQMLQQSMAFGDIRAIVGQRHYTGAPVLGWDKQFSQGDHHSVFHAYGFGGAGLTLAPAVAEYIADNVTQGILNRDSTGEALESVVILGAGYIGILAAKEIRKQLDANHLQEVPVRVVAHSYPEGSSKLFRHFREPVPADNYASRCAGGWVMPVSVQPLANETLWCTLVARSQDLWQQYSLRPPLSHATHMTTSLVFYDTLLGAQVGEDKSGIRAVNKGCPLTLYPESPVYKNFLSASGQPVDFQQVVAFDNIIQTDTLSVLRYFLQQGLEQSIEFIQTDEPLKDMEQLDTYLPQQGHAVIVNASGNGACELFGCKPAVPVRGDLVVLRMPVSRMTTAERDISRFTFWAGGEHYVFFRYSLDRQWFEVVLGGSFLKGDDDLQPRPKTVSQIINFWLNFFHQIPAGIKEEQERITFVQRILKHMGISEQ